MFTINGRTQSEQAERHGDACMQYAREALAAGDADYAEAKLHAAELWFAESRRIAGA